VDLAARPARARRRLCGTASPATTPAWFIPVGWTVFRVCARSWLVGR